MPGLMLGATLCLSSCAGENYKPCPVYPLAGPSVAAELQQFSAEECPALWEWIGRINKLRQELDLCQQLQGD